MSIAEEGIKALKPYTDVLIEIPNHKLASIIDSETLVTQTFEKSNEVLKRAVQSISDIITSKGFINVDFQDVKAIMQNAGEAMLGFGEASGDDRASKATKMAVTSPLLDNVNIEGAKGILVNMTGNSNDLKMDEFEKAMSLISASMSIEGKHIFGLAFDNELVDTIRITVIATGFSGERKSARQKKFSYKSEEKKQEEKNIIMDDLKKPAFKRRKTSKLK